MAYEIKRGDRRPRWRVALKADGVAVDLTAAVSYKFTMKMGGTVKVNKATMIVVVAASGIIEYAWGATDTDTAGTYDAEVEVDWGSSEVQSFPSTGYFTIQINEDLA